MKRRRVILECGEFIPQYEDDYGWCYCYNLKDRIISFTTLEDARNFSLSFETSLQVVWEG